MCGTTEIKMKINRKSVGQNIRILGLGARGSSVCVGVRLEEEDYYISGRLEI